MNNTKQISESRSNYAKNNYKMTYFRQQFVD